MYDNSRRTRAAACDATASAAVAMGTYYGDDCGTEWCTRRGPKFDGSVPGSVSVNVNVNVDLCSASSLN